MTTALKVSKKQIKSQHKAENKRESELCFLVICIIHFDGWILDPIPGSFVSADYKDPVSSATQATKRRLSKGRSGLSSQDLRLCYRLVPGEAALGSSAGGKLPVHAALVRSGRLHGWHSAPEFQYGSRLVGFLKDERRALEILLWLIAVTLKAGRRRKGCVECLGVRGSHAKSLAPSTIHTP